MNASFSLRWQGLTKRTHFARSVTVAALMAVPEALTALHVVRVVEVRVEGHGFDLVHRFGIAEREDRRVGQPPVLAHAHPDGLFVAAGLEDDSLVFGQFFIHQRGQVVEVSQRRLSAEFTVAEEMLHLVLTCQADVFRFEMLLNGVQVDPSVRRKHAQIVLPICPDGHRFGDLSRGDMLNGGQLFGGIDPLVLCDSVLAVFFVEKL